MIFSNECMFDRLYEHFNKLVSMIELDCMVNEI